MRDNDCHTRFTGIPLNHDPLHPDHTIHHGALLARDALRASAGLSIGRRAGGDGGGSVDFFDCSEGEASAFLLKRHQEGFGVRRAPDSHQASGTTTGFTR